jgi:hypothetical protein
MNMCRAVDPGGSYPGSFGASFDGLGVIPPVYGVLKLATPTNALACLSMADTILPVEMWARNIGGDLVTRLGAGWSWRPISADFNPLTLTYNDIVPYLAGPVLADGFMFLAGTSLFYPPGAAYLLSNEQYLVRGPGNLGGDINPVYTPLGYTVYGLLLSLNTFSVGPLPNDVFTAGTAGVPGLPDFNLFGWL